jgi:hypothetical protein
MRSAVAVVVAATLILAAGGAAVASNMGFKLNQPLVLSGAGGIGDNWTSIPYLNPYTSGCSGAAAGQSCLGALCTALGLPLATSLLMVNADTGANITSTCVLSTANTIPIPTTPQARAVKIRGGATPASVIIVGSHNPSIAQILYPADGAAPNGHNWWAVPYHTTAVTYKDLCNQIGLPGAASLLMKNPTTGGNIGPFTCLSPSANTTNLVLGRGVRILNGSTTATTTFTPAHF